MFELSWSPEATEQYNSLKAASDSQQASRKKRSKKKSTKAEGLFKQVCKTLMFLRENPKHNSLQTHEYHSLPHPWDSMEKVFEAYVQQDTPGAYRLFWCYGPNQGQIRIISITPHP